MDSFTELLKIIDRLLGPGGCPWDQEQTLKSLRASPLEEAFELAEAIDIGGNAHIAEELGDLLFNAVFLCRLGEKEERFTLQDVLLHLNEKLIRRHPHVFGEGEAGTSEEVLLQWEKIKKSERGKEERRSALDSLPKGLPTLTRAIKSIKKMRKANYIFPQEETADARDENALGNLLVEIIASAQDKGLDVEHALRKAIHRFEEDFRDKEHRA